MQKITVSMCLLWAVAGCFEAELVSGAADDAAVPAFQAACAQSIRRGLLSPDTAEITFDQAGGQVRAVVRIVNPEDGFESRSDYICEQDADGGVSARLLAG